METLHFISNGEDPYPLLLALLNSAVEVLVAFRELWSLVLCLFEVQWVMPKKGS